MPSSGLKDPIKVVIFDMDNTLFDFVSAKLAACSGVCTILGRGDGNELFRYFCRENAGFENTDNIRDYMMDLSCFHEGLFLECCRIYNEEKIRLITPYPGTRDTLMIIRDHGLLTALVTDAHSRDARLRLEKTGLSGLFDTVVAYDHTMKKKPGLTPFLHALSILNATPGQAMILGDSPRRDIAPGRELGMMTVYARYGDRFAKKGYRGGADFCIDDIRELPGLIIPGYPYRGQTHLFD